MKPRKGRTTSGTRKSSAKTQSKTRSSSKSSLKNIVEVDEDEEEALLTTAPSTPRPQTPEQFSVSAALPVLDTAYSAPQPPDTRDDIEPETVYPIPQPQTSPNKVITPSPKTMSIPTAAEPPLIHALSKLPFTPLHALTNLI